MLSLNRVASVPLPAALYLNSMFPPLARSVHLNLGRAVQEVSLYKGEFRGIFKKNSYAVNLPLSSLSKRGNAQCQFLGIVWPRGGRLSMTAQMVIGKAHVGRCGKVLILALALSWVAGFVSEVQAAQGFFGPLQQRLIQDGFAPGFVRQVYQSNPVPLFETVASTLRIRESKLNYNQFLQPAAMARARQFAVGYSGALSHAEKEYGVNRYVIVAILSVETRFGNYTGYTPTLDILSTFAVMDRKSYRDVVWGLLSAKDRKRWGREAFDQKLLKRSQWAYQELCSLLTWADGRPSKVRAFKGSLMGAIGWPQFLPSSLVQHGADGNGDGQVDLFEPTDAIVSVASYLSAYGWKSAENRAEKEKVIYAYNHSRPYVDTILGIADRLQQGN